MESAYVLENTTLDVQVLGSNRLTTKARTR